MHWIFKKSIDKRKSSFAALVQEFLGNHKAKNYVELVAKLVKTCGEMGCKMSFKVLILDVHLDEFKENMGAYSEEQGKRFHQDILDFELRYQEQYNERKIGDDMWEFFIKVTDSIIINLEKPYIFN